MIVTSCFRVFFGWNHRHRIDFQTFLETFVALMQRFARKIGFFEFPMIVLVPCRMVLANVRIFWHRTKLAFQTTFHQADSGVRYSP